jgi:hypothetical protein
MSAYRAGGEDQDPTDLCLREVMLLHKGFPKALKEDFLIDSTMNGSEDLLMEERPRMETFTSEMSNFRPGVS